MRLIILFCSISFLSTDISFAAGMIMRIQQMKEQKQQGQMTPEQYQQYQEYQEQQQGVEGQTPQAPAPPTYDQTVDARNQAIAQAIISAHNPAVAGGIPPTGNNTAINQAQPNSGYSPIQQPGPSDAQDEVDLTEVWKKLDNRSKVWTILADDQAKLLTVSEYISRFQQEGVKINEPPTHYVQSIDQIAQNNPQMLEMPFGQLLQVLAIVDYDFDNGMDKDMLAKKVLGEAGYEANKKRFTQASQQPQQQ